MFSLRSLPFPLVSTASPPCLWTSQGRAPPPPLSLHAPCCVSLFRVGKIRHITHTHAEKKYRTTVEGGGERTLTSRCPLPPSQRVHETDKVGDTMEPEPLKRGEQKQWRREDSILSSVLFFFRWKGREVSAISLCRCCCCRAVSFVWLY